MLKPHIWWIVFVIAISLGLIGDLALKRAGVNNQIDWTMFIIGFVSYSFTSFGWFLLMRGKEISYIGTIYPVAMAIGLAILGITIFHEAITNRGWLGIIFGIISLLILFNE